MKTAIVIPTYNEAQNIQNMVDAILELNNSRFAHSHCG